MTPRPTNPPADRPEGDAPSFEEALRRLEAIVEELEHGALSLEDSIRRYEEGIGLSRRLTALLETAEQRIERLVEREPGAPGTEPMRMDDDPSPRATRRGPEVAHPPEASRPAERRPTREPEGPRGDDAPARSAPHGGTEELPF